MTRQTFSDSCVHFDVFIVFVKCASNKYERNGNRKHLQAKSRLRIPTFHHQSRTTLELKSFLFRINTNTPKSFNTIVSHSLDFPNRSKSSFICAVTQGRVSKNVTAYDSGKAYDVTLKKIGFYSIYNIM